MKYLSSGCSLLGQPRQPCLLTNYCSKQNSLVRSLALHMPGAQHPFYISESINEQLMYELMSVSSYAQGDGLDLAV